MGKNKNEKPETTEVIMSAQVAENYTGVKWRRPTEAEIEELAEWFAIEEVEGENRVFRRDWDHVEKTLEFERKKKELIEEITPLAMVQDLVNFDVQIFYTYLYIISAGNITGELHFEDNMCKILKYKGDFSYLDFPDQSLFIL